MVVNVDGNTIFDNLLHFEKALELKISGIIRQKEDSDSSMLSEGIGYTSLLTKEIIKKAKEYGLKIKAKDAIAILKVADNNLTRVKKALDVLGEQKNKITNITGWLITAIIDDYELAKKPYDLANKFHNFEERKTITTN